MLDRPCAKELEGIVESMLSQSPHDMFKRCLALYGETAHISEPRGFYFRITEDAAYRNLVIAGDSGIVDIEADESSSEDREVSIYPYRSIMSVILHVGSIPTLPRTRNSLLTVACLSASNSIACYWSAHSEDEGERLSSFAGILVKAISD